MLRNCDFCNTEYKYDGHHNIKFCSKKCQFTYYKQDPKRHEQRPERRNRILLNCRNCKKEIYEKPSQIHSKNGMFCGKKCYSEWQSKMIRGKNHPNYKEYTVICKNCGKIEKMSSTMALYGKRKFCNVRCSSEFSKKSRLGKNNPYYKEKIKRNCEICKKIFCLYPSESYKRRFCSWNCWLIYLKDIRKISDLNRQKMLESLLKRPTTPEKIIIDLINKNNLPFKYVGNGSFIISGLNPDFIERNGRKLIIEVFGDYWHRKGATKFRQTEYGRRIIFRKCGYKILILWENEIYDNKNKILDRIKNFMEEDNMENHTEHSQFHKEQIIKNAVALEDHLRTQPCPECMANNQ